MKNQILTFVFITFTSNFLLAEKNDTLKLFLYSNVSINKIMVTYNKEIISKNYSKGFLNQYDILIKNQIEVPYENIPLRILVRKPSGFKDLKLPFLFIYYPELKFIHLYLDLKKKKYCVYYLPNDKFVVNPRLFF
jgi:hypothetical protein